MDDGGMDGGMDDGGMDGGVDEGVRCRSGWLDGGVDGCVGRWMYE